jgi:Z1 domain
MTAEVWAPEVGRQTDDLLDSQELEASSKQRLLDSSRRTLSRCGSPEAEGEHRGSHLVVGEIQSGKTLAFTTLMALARDNGFRLIIVIAGTKTNLLKQTAARLNDDLLKGTGGLNPWRYWITPDPSIAPDIGKVLGKRRNPKAKIDGSQTVVLFVLKHGVQLKKLRDVLEAIGEPILREAPALVVDDEADQASLNLLHHEGEISPIHGSISDVRAALPRHDLMMYTATPQGPLLVQLGDELSPDTVTVLESGPDYVGGSELFVEASNHYLERIPEREVEAAREPGAPPPTSLRRAIATYLLVLVIAQERRRPRPLSMLVHPAVARDLHHRYAAWSKLILEDLESRLEDAEDVIFAEALKEDFEGPYEDLAKTVKQIPPLAELAELIPPYAQQVEVRVVNAGSKAIDDWKESPGWIVVGGNKLERGFTIENLAITYMPRGRGAHTVDTIQQRARFFGYKRPYLDLCRGWFTADVADIYAKYVGHEDALQAALALVDQSGRPLRSWRRELLLSPSLQPTRRRVVSLDTDRYTLTSRDGWFRQSRLFDREAARANAALAERLFERYRGQAAPERLDPRRARQHQTAEASLGSLYEALAEWEAVSEDYERLLGLSLVLAQMLEEDPRAKCRLIFMDGIRSLGDRERRRRRRQQQSEGPTKTVEIFQGEDSANRYPGDRGIRDSALVSVQLHLLDLHERDGSLWAEGVPAVAVYVPGDAPTLILQR